MTNTNLSFGQDGTLNPSKKIIKASHCGIVEIAPGYEIECSVLEDGRSVVMQKDVLKTLGKDPKSGVTKNGVLALATNLKPFDNSSLLERPRIEFLPVGHKATRANGYDAQVILEICRVYSRAFIAGVLHHRQVKTGRIALAILDALAGVGLEALIHEATGYREKLEADAYQRLYYRFLSPNLVPWMKTFPDEFFFNICRLKRWSYGSRSQPKWPQYMGKLVLDLVYRALPKEVLEDLKSRTPRSEDGALKNRLFQYLSEDFGSRVLRERIKVVTFCLRISDSWEAFEHHLSRMDPDRDWQTLMFNDPFAIGLSEN